MYLFQILLYKPVPKPAMFLWLVYALHQPGLSWGTCTTFFSFKIIFTAIEIATWRLFSHNLVQECSLHQEQLPWRAIIFCRSCLSAHLTCLSAHSLPVKASLSRDHQKQRLDYLKGIWKKSIKKYRETMR